jgi:hypothetical protein
VKVFYSVERKAVLKDEQTVEQMEIVLDTLLVCQLVVLMVGNLVSYLDHIKVAVKVLRGVEQKESL